MAKFILPKTLKDSPDAESIETMGQGIVDAVEESTEAAINKKLEEYAKGGVSKETIESIEKAIDEQGAAITKMREQGINSPVAKSAMDSIRKEFFARYGEVEKAIQANGNSPMTIKAVDEHNPAYIETTETAITTTDGSFLPENVRDGGTFMHRFGRNFIRFIANVINVGRVPEAVTFTEEGTETGSFAIVEENALKPQLFLTLIKSTVLQQKVAGYIVATEELIRNRVRAWAAIMRMFRSKFERDYEAILYTAFTGRASAYTTTPLDGTITNPQDIHAIIAAMAQIESLNFIPDTLVLNPADKWQLALNTTPNGCQYLFMPSLISSEPMTPLGLRVITSTNIPAGTFLVGESGTFEIEESAPELRVGYVNDDLIHNRRTFVLERYFLTWLPANLAGAWVLGDFADIKEALQAPPTA